MTTITAEIDGQTFTVDLARVSGLDALSYRHSVGAELDALILGWLEAGRVPAFLADLAVVRWLWERQNVDTLASLPAVASSVTLLPAPDPVDVPPSDPPAPPTVPPAPPESPSPAPAPVPAPVPAVPPAMAEAAV